MPAEGHSKGTVHWCCQTKEGGKHIAQVKFTYQIHRLNQKREKPLVRCSSKCCVKITLSVLVEINPGFPLLFLYRRLGVQ